jgi:branched-chain amino acid transport system permease protein
MIEVVIYGTIIGAIWALVSSGFSLVFGVARILNFAHGTFFVLGAYIAIVLHPYLGVFSIVPAIVIVGLIGIAVYRYLISPVKHYEVMVILITLALALLVEEILLTIFKDISVSYPSLMSGLINIAGVPVPLNRILIFVVALAVIFCLDYFIRNTKVGKFIMATSQDMEAAMLVGIDVERVFSITMAISAVLAALAGILYAQIYAVNPQTAFRVLIYAFAIVILGGLGSVRGSIVASFIIGFIQVAISMFYEPRWAEIAALATIIFILIVRPKGLFGVE